MSHSAKRRKHQHSPPAHTDDSATQSTTTADASNWSDHHPASLYYNNPPDYLQLATLYPNTFGQHCTIRRDAHTQQSVHVKFHHNDVAALHCLTATLLQHDFGVHHWSMPQTSLCPPVPQRLNYLLWVGCDLLGVEPCTLLYNNRSVSAVDSSVEFTPSSAPASPALRGIDIGCGASLIFPLLALRTFPKCRMVATDIDSASINNSRTICKLNAINDETIHLVHNTNAKQTLDGVVPQLPDGYAFTVCNPPFFATLSEAASSADRTERASLSELVCEGGEAVFIQKLATDSALPQWRESVKWYTTMLGVKKHVNELKAFLWQLRPSDTPTLRVQCVVTTEFRQGRQSRWGLAWTWQAEEAKLYADRQRQR